MNLSFAGCGFLGIYHVGVAACFRKYAPHLLLHKISGASAGALAACCLLCDLPLGDMTSDVLRVAGKARTSILGPFSPSFNVQEVLIEGLKRYLPEDAHIRVSGKLFISMTRVCDGKNVIISNYECRDDLIDALLASAFIPFFSGIVPPKYHGVRYMDGGFSDNLPQIDENTITVSPFCGESDICPRDESSQLFHINFSNTSIELSKQNIYRLVRILFPPKPEILSNMCKQGFDDALRFLHRNNLINCTRCLAIQSTYVVSETIDENFEYDPQCKECKVHIEEALVSNIPDTVMTILQDAIESANKGIVNWVFKHRGMKILSILSLPYALPADIVYATFTKFLAAAPKMKHNLWEMSRFLIDQLGALFNMNKNKHDYSNSTLSCHLAISEYGGTKYDSDANSIAVETKNQMNLNFTLNLDENEHHKTMNSRRFSANNILGRNQNPSVHKSDGFVDDDTFEHILEVTSHHETVMAYYYMDENNKVKVTEIFDVTDSECEAVQSSYERERNTQLQFDDEWDDSTWLTTQSKREDDYFNDQDSITGLSITSMEEILECDSNGIFSDPESEWNGTIKIEIPDENDLSTDADLRPESDQPCQILRKPYTIPSSVVFDS